MVITNRERHPVGWMVEIMKRFEIRMDRTEVRKAQDVKKGCILNDDVMQPETVATFETLTEAREALKNYNSSVAKLRSAYTYYLVEEYYIAEVEFDEDYEEWTEGDIYDFAEFLENSDFLELDK